MLMLAALKGTVFLSFDVLDGRAAFANILLPFKGGLSSQIVGLGSIEFDAEMAPSRGRHAGRLGAVFPDVPRGLTVQAFAAKGRCRKGPFRCVSERARVYW